MNSRIFLSIIASIFLSGSGINAQTPYFYYYQGEKQYLNLDQSRMFFSITDTTQLNLTSDVKKSHFRRDIPANRGVKQSYAKRYWQELTLGDNLFGKSISEKNSIRKAK